MSDVDVEKHLQGVIAPAAFQGQERDDEFRISIAGAQEKTALLRLDGRGHRPLGATPSTHILKMPLGLVGGLLLTLWADGAALLLQGCGSVIESVLYLVQWVVDLPLLGGWKIYLSPAQTSGVALLCSIPCIVGRAKNSWIFRSLLLTVAVMLLCWRPAAPAKISVTALSVGQGDAFLVSRDDGRNYLIDGGGLHGSNFDVGERLLAPALAHLGIRTFDAIILTHDQADHRRGLPYIMARFPVRTFWCSEDPEKLNVSLKETLREQNVPTYRFPPGWSIIEETHETTMAIFVPTIDTSNPNDRSLVLYLRQGDDGLLLTGDLETPGVVNLLAFPPPGPVNLLKLPHHGSRKSSPELLLDQLRPQLTFVSVGAGNTFRFPHAEVVADLEQRGTPLFRTDKSGSIRFLSDGDGWHIQHWNRGLFR
jgi:competence protein ComEC